jgi:hypothetical protein
VFVPASPIAKASNNPQSAIAFSDPPRPATRLPQPLR